MLTRVRSSVDDLASVALVPAPCDFDGDVIVARGSKGENTLAAGCVSVTTTSTLPPDESSLAGTDRAGVRS